MVSFILKGMDLKSRDLKADLAYCKKLNNIYSKGYVAEKRRANNSEALVKELEKALRGHQEHIRELENQNDILATTLNMYCSPYYKEKERADKYEALIRCLTDEIEQDEADGIPISKKERDFVMRAKEVLGDD